MLTVLHCLNAKVVDAIQFLKRASLRAIHVKSFSLYSCRWLNWISVVFFVTHILSAPIVFIVIIQVASDVLSGKFDSDNFTLARNGKWKCLGFSRWCSIVEDLLTSH
jgi:hypothetical protein